MTEEKEECYYIDTHAHLDMLKSRTPEEAVSQAGRENVRYIINVGSSLDGSRKSLEFSRSFNNVFATIGIHPHYTKGFGRSEEQNLELLISGHKKHINKGESNADENTKSSKVYKNGKVVAVGEIGFDFYRNLSPKKDQERAFITQVELAVKYNLPVIIHDRDAHQDTLRIVRKYAGSENFRAVMHCFSGDSNFAEECLKLGLFISFTGILTFPNAKKTVDAARIIPINRIFIETDSPFLAPQARRGKENYPGYVKYVAEKIAEIKDLDLTEVAAVTSKDAEEFFSLNKYISSS